RGPGRRTAMRTILTLLVASVGLTLSYPVFACGDAEVRIQPRQISFVDQAAALRAQADRMEGRASADDRTADSLSREGEQLLVRARALRQQALGSLEFDQPGLIARAEALASQAAASLSQASRMREEARELRMQARTLRERAIQI